MDTIKREPMIAGNDNVMLYGGMFGGGYLIDNHGNYIKDHDGNYIRVAGVLEDRPVCHIGGRYYNAVSIGGMVWMAENLDLKATGIEISPSGSPATPAAWYYDNDEATYGVDGNRYGLLYNYYAVQYLNNNRATLFPGWHVPTADEWDALSAAVDGADNAAKLKSRRGWDTSNGVDVFGFCAFPAGAYYGYTDGGFVEIGTGANFFAISAFYSFGDTRIMYHQSSGAEKSGFSVRLVKDS